MLRNDYRYALALYSEDGRQIGQAAVEVDWEPAREWAEFEAIRRSHTASAASQSRFSIEPSWHEGLNEPFMNGFYVRVSCAGEEMLTHIPSSYFNALATQASKHFMEQGALKQGDSFFSLPLAFPKHEEEAKEETKLNFRTEEVTPPLVIREGLFEEYEGRALRQGPFSEDDFPVFVPERVLLETAALSRQAEARETGGILIGHLRRDAHRGGQVFAEVTAEIPAQHTVAELARLTFTSETWTQVRAALELRRREEIMLGWWHSHPAREWCKACPVEKQRVCQMAKEFFSEHDRALHRTIFPKAYSIALVVNDVAFDEPSFSLFGWRRGLLLPRSFFVTDPRSETVAA
jgi:hypothetical protein